VERSLARVRGARCLAHIEFENTPDHDKIPRAVAILGAYKAKRLSAIDEKPAADPAWILDDPVPLTVTAYPK